MKLHDLEFYREDGFIFEQFTVITSTPQTTASWLATDLVKRHNGQLIELGVTKPSFPSAENEFLIVMNTELPILSGHVQADEMVSLLHSLEQRTKHLVVCLTISDALVDTYYDTGIQLARLATKLLYKAQLIIQLRPLETGRARDITGRFIVAKGPRGDATSARSAIERELFYYVGPRGVVELKTKK